MLCRLMLIAAVFGSAVFVTNVNDASAARRGLLRLRHTRSTSYRYSSYNKEKRFSEKHFLTHSPNAIFQHYEGVYGHDGSYFIGK